MIGACTTALFLFFRSEKIGLSFGELVAYLLTAAAFGAVGSKVLFAVSMIPSSPDLTVGMALHYLINGGYVFYGGLFGVILGIITVSRVRKRDVMETLDFASPAFPLFHSIARIGCLFAGCCYGVPWSWGVVLQGENIVRFPVQLVESFCDVLIFALLLHRAKKVGSDKGNFALYMTTYAVCRFILEFFRGDTVRGLWAFGLSTSQVIALTVLAFSLSRAIIKKALGKKEN